MTFDFYLGGYGRAHSYRLVLNGDRLIISDNHDIPIPEHKKSVTVDENKDWKLLVEFLKECKWNKRYDSDVLDGTQWELRAKGQGINVKSCGSNAYPYNFDQFLVLLNKVTGVAGVRICK